MIKESWNDCPLCWLLHNEKKPLSRPEKYGYNSVLCDNEIVDHHYSINFENNQIIEEYFTIFDCHGQEKISVYRTADDISVQVNYDNSFILPALNCSVESFLDPKFLNKYLMLI